MKLRDAVSELSQPPANCLLCSLTLAVIMITYTLFYCYYFLLIAVHAKLPTQGIACLMGSYSQKLDTGADNLLSDI